MNNNTTTYEQQANDFLAKNNATFSSKFVKHGLYFDDDKEGRDIYEITLTCNQRSYTFTFGNSIHNSGQYILLDHLLIKKYGKRVVSAAEYSKMSPHDKKETRPNKNYSQPSAYSVLSCLTKNDPGSFDDFCSEFGYDTDSKKADKVYQSIFNEYNNLCRLFTENQLEELREIN